MASLAELVVDLKAETSSFQRQMNAARQELSRLNTTVTKHRGSLDNLDRSLRRVASPLERLATEAIGANSAMGRLGTVLAEFGVGGVYTVAALAGIAAIGLAWEKLTEKSRQHQEELHNLALQGARDMTALLKQIDPTIGFAPELKADVEAINEKQALVDKLARQRGTLAALGPLAAVFPISDARNAAQLKAALADLQGATAEYMADLNALNTARARGLKTTKDLTTATGDQTSALDKLIAKLQDENFRALTSPVDVLTTQLRAGGATQAMIDYALALQAGTAGAKGLREALKGLALPAVGLPGVDAAGDLARIKAGLAGPPATTTPATVTTAVKPAADAYAALWKKAARESQDALTDFFDSIGTSAQSAVQVLTSLLQSIRHAVDAYLSASVLQALGIGATSAAAHHTGGIAGSGNASRLVPAYAFAAAPRYHAGGIAGLAPDEVPAVLQRGERVLPRGAGGGPSGQQVTIHSTQHYTIQALDAAGVDEILRRHAGTLAELHLKAARHSTRYRAALLGG